PTAGEAAHALELALVGRRANSGDLHVEYCLDGRADLDLVGVGAHAEGDGIPLLLLAHRLFSHDRTDEHLARVPHSLSPSCIEVSAACSNTTWRAWSSWSTETWVGGSTVSHGTLRAARASGWGSLAVTSSVGSPATPIAVSVATSAFVLPSKGRPPSTTRNAPSAIRAATAARSASRRISPGSAVAELPG